MAKFSTAQWNLCQALGWCVSRAPEVVEFFGFPNLGDWQSWLMYPSNWPVPSDHPHFDLLVAALDAKDHVRINKRAAIYTDMQAEAYARVLEFHGALIDGDLEAFAWSERGSQTIEGIPKEEWGSLVMEPPLVYRTTSTGERVYAWHDVYVERDAVLSQWPGTLLPTKRQSSRRKDWAAVDRALDALAKTVGISQEISDRELASRVHRKLAGAIDPKLIPGDRALRGHIADRRRSGTFPLRHQK